MLLEVERYEEGLYLSFKILDPTKMDEIISLFKDFCEGLNIKHLDIFDEITDFCENNSDS